MPNIYDVAKEAGVSRSTVSRVINNQKSVKDDKRERVLAAIAKLNYTPNATARALAMNRTNTIGVIARRLTDNFNAEFISSVHDAADENHYGAIFCMRTIQDQANINYIDFLNKKVDGFIFIGEETVTEDELKSLATSEIPVVAMESTHPVDSITYITVDNFNSAYRSVEYLVSLGHKKIVNLSTTDMTQEKDLRAAAYEEAIKKSQLDYIKSFDISYEVDEAKAHLKMIIPQLIEDGVTAAFCFNNMIATMFSEALIGHGIRIPEDFSVVGFDDIEYRHLSDLPLPRLTSSKQPQKEMASYAVEELIKQIERPKDTPIESASKEFKCQLNIRQSTGVVPHND